MNLGLSKNPKHRLFTYWYSVDHTRNPQKNLGNKNYAKKIGEIVGLTAGGKTPIEKLDEFSEHFKKIATTPKKSAWIQFR